LSAVPPNELSVRCRRFVTGLTPRTPARPNARSRSISADTQRKKGAANGRSIHALSGMQWRAMGPTMRHPRSRAGSTIHRYRRRKLLRRRRQTNWWRQRESDEHLEHPNQDPHLLEAMNKWDGAALGGAILGVRRSVFCTTPRSRLRLELPLRLWRRQVPPLLNHPHRIEALARSEIKQVGVIAPTERHVRR
jgi:hypothetical protein